MKSNSKHETKKEYEDSVIRNVKSEWFTRKEASLYLSCSINYLDTRCPIKKYYLGKSVRYNKNDLDIYLQSNCRNPKQNKGENNG